MKVLILTPLFFGDSSGAAVYYKILANSFIQSGYAVSVISDKETGEFQGQYYGLLPSRCGREKRFPRDVFAYAIQNLKYLSIPKIIRYEQPNTLLVHSSFYNHPGAFASMMNMVRKRFSELTMVLDVRDRLVPAKQVKSFSIFDCVIACSENIMLHLCRHGLIKEQVTLIPVVQEKIDVDKQEAWEFTRSLKLKPLTYIFYAGLVKEAKGISVLLDAFLNYVKAVRPDVKLVISGLLKTQNERVLSALKEDGVAYLGNRKRSDVLKLMSCARLCVNLSPIEGMPRTSLESLALQKPTILPPNVPEFGRHCPDFVALDSNPKAVADKIIELLDTQAVPSYPIENHLPENVLPKYMAILSLNSSSMGRHS